MLKTANLGFPRIGANRELKKAVESYWKKISSAADLQKSAAQIREKNWRLQKAAGIAFIPSNDFSFYDQTLDCLALFGAVPDRFKFSGGNVDLDLYFAMARGNQSLAGIDVTAMEMTKWFDTNYHYIVGEFKAGQTFKLSSTKIFDEYLEAKRLGIETRPVLTGNFLSQPSMRRIGRNLPHPDEFPNANHISRSSFLVGAHHDLNDSQVDFLCSSLIEVSKLVDR